MTGWFLFYMSTLVYSLSHLFLYLLLFCYRCQPKEDGFPFWVSFSCSYGVFPCCSWLAHLGLGPGFFFIYLFFKSPNIFWLQSCLPAESSLNLYPVSFPAHCLTLIHLIQPNRDLERGWLAAAFVANCGWNEALQEGRTRAGEHWFSIPLVHLAPVG